jgi:predicted TIM-barrel fold metal-dependent hydrolase
MSDSHETTTRRNWIGAAGAGVGAALLGHASSVFHVALANDDSKPASSDPPMPIIDTHQHLWDLKKFRLRWLEGDGSKDSGPKKIAHSFSTADYAEATKGLGVEQSVYMEVDVDPEQQQAEADHVIALGRLKDNTLTGAVISGRPEDESFAAYIKPFKGEKFIKGVRRLLNPAAVKTGTCLSKTFLANVRLLGEMGKHFDVTCRSAELGDIAKLIEACPDTRFVIDHCGGIDATATLDAFDGWKRGLALVAKSDRAICKISGIVATAKEHWTADELAPAINYCLDTFGPDRVVFGGDWPVCTLRASFAEWVAALRQIVNERPEKDQRKLWHDNAVRFYGLPSKPKQPSA